MKPHVIDAVRKLVERYALHADPSGPVPIFNLEPMFPAVRRDFGPMGVAGMVILPETLPVTESNFAQVVLNKHLGPDGARLVYAHEVGHAIAGHVGELMCSNMDNWFTNRAEHQAWEIAARLLIPEPAWVDRRDIQRMSAVFRVPPSIVKLAAP